MRFLLDTHTLLWHAHNDPRLSAKARALVADPANQLCFSMASVWEIAIKSGLGKLSLKEPYPTFVTRAISIFPLTLLPITFDDCIDYETLGFPIPNHRDPFDRMLITHAFRHGLTIVGNDAKFDGYGVPRRC